MNRFWPIVVLFGLFRPAQVQAQYQSQVTAILEDRQGFLWFGGSLRG